VEYAKQVLSGVRIVNGIHPATVPTEQQQPQQFQPPQFNQQQPHQQQVTQSPLGRLFPAAANANPNSNPNSSANSVASYNTNTTKQSGNSRSPVPPLHVQTQGLDQQSAQQRQQQRARSSSPTGGRNNNANNLARTQSNMTVNAPISPSKLDPSRKTAASISHQVNFVPAPQYFHSFHNMGTQNNNSFMNGQANPGAVGGGSNMQAYSNDGGSVSGASGGPGQQLSARDTKWDLFQPSPRTGKHSRQQPFMQMQGNAQSPPRAQSAPRMRSTASSSGSVDLTMTSSADEG
jgi:hypothetical protein